MNQILNLCEQESINKRDRNLFAELIKSGIIDLARERLSWRAHFFKTIEHFSIVKPIVGVVCLNARFGSRFDAHFEAHFEVPFEVHFEVRLVAP